MPRARMFGLCLTLPLILAACGTHTPALTAQGAGRIVRSQAWAPSNDVDRDLEQALRQRPDYLEVKQCRTWPGRGREAGLVWYFCVAYLGTQGLVYVDGYRTELTEPARIVFRNVTTGGLPFPDGCR